MTEMDIHEIFEALPHRYPFLFVDRIIECEGERKIVGQKNLTFNEPFFQGHFPGKPVMPGVIQLEAMAQVGGILLNHVANTPGKIAYFTKVDKARCRRVLIPGDVLRIESEMIKHKGRIAVVDAKIFVDGQLASEAELMFAQA